MKTRTVKLKVKGPHNRPVKMRIIEGGETIIFREHRMRRHTRISASRLFQLANDDAIGQYNLFSAASCPR